MKKTDDAGSIESPGAALARLRWSRVAPAERSRIASELAQARWEQMSPEERRKIARRAARARWARAKKRPK
jgi:predicted Fe-S protein YdhL (DUF1289 family)